MKISIIVGIIGILSTGYANANNNHEECVQYTLQVMVANHVGYNWELHQKWLLTASPDEVAADAARVYQYLRQLAEQQCKQ